MRSVLAAYREAIYSMSEDYGVRCGDCGSPMVLRVSTWYKYPSGAPRKFWQCSRAPACRGCLGAHPSGAPHGTPADYDTRQARKRAHIAFDAAADARGLDVKARYRWLQELTGLSMKAAHIAKFSREECEALIERIALLEAVRELSAAPAVQEEA